MPTFAEFVAGYLKSPAWSSKALSTRRSDQGRLDHALLPALGRLRVTEIMPAQVEALRRDLCDTARAEALARKGGATKAVRRGGQGGARATIRFLRSLLGIAVKQKLITSNPGAKCRVGEVVVQGDGAIRAELAAVGGIGPASLATMLGPNRTTVDHHAPWRNIWACTYHADQHGVDPAQQAASLQPSRRRRRADLQARPTVARSSRHTLTKKVPQGLRLPVPPLASPYRPPRAQGTGNAGASHGMPRSCTSRSAF